MSKAQSDGPTSFSGKSQDVSKEISLASGKCYTKQVRLTKLFCKTTFKESCFKVNLLTDKEKKYTDAFTNHCIKLLNSVDSLMAQQH